MIKNGCGGLGFRVAAKDSPDVASLERLRDAHRWTALSSRRHEIDVARVAGLLEANGVTALIGKGFAVARHYPGPGLRPYGDIDVYVPRSQAGAAAAALALASEISVDLHDGYADLDDREPGELRRRSVVVDVLGTPAHLFGTEDHLRLICIHAARHGALRALWLCDIALLLESLPPTFDWAYFSLGDPDRTETALGILGLAHALLGARLDLGAVNPARLDPPAWLIGAVLSEWGRKRTPHGARRPWRAEMMKPWRWPGAARLRWPNALEAACETRTPLSRAGSVTVQLAACVRRIKRQAGSA